MSEFMISVNSRARGERRQLPRTKKVRSAPGAPSAGSLVRPREPSRWSRRRSAHPKLVHVHPCCRLQPQTLQLRACLPNEKKTLTSKPHLPPRDPHHRLACWPASATIALLLLARLKGRLSPLRLQHPRPGTRFDTIGVGNI